jgi:glycosyltransferase involved in cell wall biosynthesis
MAGCGGVSGGPLVSVVTPVHNGAAHLAECIESVLAQTYEHWEYVIVDNCSTDASAEIARGYAERDGRVRVVANDRFLDIIQNWNFALRQISAESTYCKVIHADDVMTPDCLERMVTLARAHPSVAIVSAYRLNGTKVDLDGVIPWGTDVISGREVCRLALLGRGYVFGSPSSLLIRSDLIRARDRFYNEQNFHADTEICFEVLQTADLGFVHQVLTHTRRHARSMTSTAARLSTHTGGWLRVMTTYGPLYLTRDEYDRRLAWWLRRYGWFLTKAALLGRFRDDRFREHHGATLRMLRQSVTPADLARGLALSLLPQHLFRSRATMKT